VFLDVETLLAVEADADACLLGEDLGRVVRAARVGGQAVGQGNQGGVGHAGECGSARKGKAGLSPRRAPRPVDNPAQRSRTTMDLSTGRAPWRFLSPKPAQHQPASLPRFCGHASPWKTREKWACPQPK